MTFGDRRLLASGAIASVVVVIVRAGPLGTALVKKDRCLMRRISKRF